LEKIINKNKNTIWDTIEEIIRNNIDIFVLYKFANTKMVLEKIYEECSAFLTEEQFEELYMHAVKEPHNALTPSNN
jgi:predicted house-cleaning noncanonical NTP pyrophosphatase (MazG superfamily)